MTSPVLNNSDVELILFDLGGVLIELTGVGKMIEWSTPALTAEGMWRKWLSSPAVRDFESGRSDTYSFATGVIEEFGLPVKTQTFLDEFLKWPKGAFPGVCTLLNQLCQTHQLGILSNTNALHWERFTGEMEFMAFFDYRFASHLTGRLKPDRETFHYVADRTGIDPGRILFFDDNQVNVNGARAAGMAAYRANGPDEVMRLLGLAPSAPSLPADCQPHQADEVRQVSGHGEL